MRVEEIDGLRLVKRLAEDMEEMFHKKAQAMKVTPPHTHTHVSRLPRRCMQATREGVRGNSQRESAESSVCVHVILSINSGQTSVSSRST